MLKRGVVGLLMGLGCLVALPHIGFAADGLSVTAPAGMVDVPYSYTFFAPRGEPEPYTWQISTSSQADILPQGISAKLEHGRDLVLYGTPTRMGAYQFTIVPISASGTILGETVVQFDIRPASEVPLILPATGPQIGAVGMPFSAVPVVRVAGGAAPYRWRMVQGGLPNGLRFTEQGTVEGVPTVAGQFVFQAEVTDARDMRATAAVTLMIQEMTTPGVVSAPTSPVTSEVTSSLPVSAPFVPPSSLSLADRLSVLTRLGLMPNTLVQASELDPLMQRASIYYLGADGRRHPFQHENIYRSWYGSSTLQPRTLSRVDMTAIPFGDAITYRPGERVRFETDPATYVVAEPKRLYRLAEGEGSAWSWQQGVELLDEAYRATYQVMNNAATPANYDSSALRARFSTPNEALMSIGL